MNVLLVYQNNGNHLCGAIQEPQGVSHEDILKAWCYRQGLSDQAYKLYRLSECPVIMWQSLLNAQKPVHEISPTLMRKFCYVE
jgi:hypothetical protein